MITPGRSVRNQMTVDYWLDWLFWLAWAFFERVKTLKTGMPSESSPIIESRILMVQHAYQCQARVTCEMLRPPRRASQRFMVA